jgi:hypothetical protein
VFGLFPQFSAFPPYTMAHHFSMAADAILEISARSRDISKALTDKMLGIADILSLITITFKIGISVIRKKFRKSLKTSCNDKFQLGQDCQILLACSLYQYQMISQQKMGGSESN